MSKFNWTVVGITLLAVIFTFFYEPWESDTETDLPTVEFTHSARYNNEFEAIERIQFKESHLSAREAYEILCDSLTRKSAIGLSKIYPNMEMLSHNRTGIAMGTVLGWNIVFCDINNVKFLATILPSGSLTIRPYSKIGDDELIKKLNHAGLKVTGETQYRSARTKSVDKEIPFNRRKSIAFENQWLFDDVDVYPILILSNAFFKSSLHFAPILEECTIDGGRRRFLWRLLHFRKDENYNTPSSLATLGIDAVNGDIYLYNKKNGELVYSLYKKYETFEFFNFMSDDYLDTLSFELDDYVLYRKKDISAFVQKGHDSSNNKDYPPKDVIALAIVLKQYNKAIRLLEINQNYLNYNDFVYLSGLVLLGLRKFNDASKLFVQNDLSNGLEYLNFISGKNAMATSIMLNFETKIGNIPLVFHSNRLYLQARKSTTILIERLKNIYKDTKDKSLYARSVYCINTQKQNNEESAFIFGMEIENTSGMDLHGVQVNLTVVGRYYRPSICTTLISQKFNLVQGQKKKIVWTLPRKSSIANMWNRKFDSLLETNKQAFVSNFAPGFYSGLYSREGYFNVHYDRYDIAEFILENGERKCPILSSFKNNLANQELLKMVSNSICD